MKQTTLSLIASSILLSSNLLGATPPSSSDILRQVEPQKVEQKESVIPEIQAPIYKAPMVVNSALLIGVKSFKITHNSVYSQTQLLSLLKEYEGKELTFAKLNEATSIVTKYYRDNGYFVARAYIPAQELEKTDAILEISIIEGSYGKMSIKNNSLVKTPIVQKYMDKLNSNIISTPSLERQMLLVDDLGGATISNVEIIPSTQVGSSDFIITTQSQPKYYGYVTADNYGSRYTGEYKITANGYINSISGKGDVLGVTATSSHNGNLKNGRISYDLPLNENGLKANLVASATNYQIGKEFTNLDIKGASDTLEAGLSYPIIRSKAHTLNSLVSYNLKHSTDKDNYQPDKSKSINSFKFSLDDSLKTSFGNKSGLLNSLITLTTGDVNLNDYSKSIDTLNADGDYAKLNFSLSQNQSLDKDYSLVASLSGQIALDRNLDGGEDFSVGGANGVRAYTDSELSGDEGYLVSLELSYKLPVLKGINHSLTTFVNHAKVWDNKEDLASISRQSRLLSAVGIGYNLSYKNSSLKFSYAHGFGADKTPTGDGDDTNLNRTFVQAMVRF